MAIQNRRGKYSDFDPSKMKAGEWAVIQSGDDSSDDGSAVYIAIEPGKVKRMATADEMNSANTEASDFADKAKESQLESARLYEEANKEAQVATQAAETATNALKNARTEISQVADEKKREISDIALESDQIAGDALVKVKDLETVVESLLKGKIDGGFSENGLLYLTANDEVVGNGIPVGYGGSGGGGGGSTNNATLTLNNTVGWINSTVAENSDCIITADWSSLENEMETGAGSLQLSVNNEVKLMQNIEQGEIKLNVGKYLKMGNNRVKLNVSDIYGNSRTINFTITMVALSLTSMFDSSIPYGGAINFTYTPTGAVEKTVHFLLDGQEIGTQVTSITGKQQSYTLSARSHGKHTFEVYFTAEINAVEVESNHLYYELICTEIGNNNTIITSDFKLDTASQYTLVNIPYQIYDPQNLSTEVKLYANDELISTQTVDRTVQTWAYRVDKMEDLKLAIVANDVRREFNLTVTDSGINVAVEEESLRLSLSSAGRSNNESNPGTWVSGDISAQFENFNFVSDCWQLDSEGIPCLRVAGDARLTIPYKVFASDFRTTGKTIEIEFAVHDVMDYDSTVLSCLDGERGLKLTAQKATMKSEQSEVFAQYKEDSHVHLTFVVEKRSENRLMYIYINGIMSGAVQYPANDDFSQMIPQDIKIGSNDCAIDLYSIRVYDNNLNRQQVLNNWIASEQNVDAMLDKYNRNNIFDEYGQIVIDKLPTYLPYFVFETAELPQSKQDKGKTASGSFVNLMNPKLNFTYENAGVGVQGTSSAGYERKNYKVKFKGFTMSDNSVTAKYSMYDGAILVATFTFKADVASSEGANNVELVRLYNDFAPKNPRQKANPQLRQGIDGFPMVVFWKNTATGETTFLGKYNFNNDKGTEEVYGFKEGDESWEILRNTSNLVLFKSADFESMTKDENGQDIPSWTLDFEGRYPDMNMDITNLKAMLEWVSSTDTSVVSDEAEKKARLQKFKDEFEQHFDLDTALYYYLFTELFLMVDSRAKNAFPTKFGDKWYWLPYDMDTALGIKCESQV